MSIRKTCPKCGQYDKLIWVQPNIWAVCDSCKMAWPLIGDSPGAPKQPDDEYRKNLKRLMEYDGVEVAA